MASAPVRDAFAALARIGKEAKALSLEVLRSDLSQDILEYVINLLGDPSSHTKKDLDKKAQSPKEVDASATPQSWKVRTIAGPSPHSLKTEEMRYREKDSYSKARRSKL